ncbi:MAG: hypothetical protein GY842_10030, partial [bacterium]|nr:hypothetical protein [bacterium]
AVGSDPDSDPITYCWEQRDLGDQAALGDPDDGAIPLFRSWPPTSSPQRVFPRLEDLLNNTTSPGEQMPTTFRTMSFRATVRDNRSGGGGSGFDDTQVTVHAGAGPFMVTAPTTGAEVWSTEGAVTWDVAATDVAPIGTDEVNILLSTNGGNTYPYTLIAGTANDGSELVPVPPVTTTTARVMVEAVGNIFFDVSSNDFEVAPPALEILLPGGAPETMVPGIPLTFVVQVTSLGQDVVPGTEILHYRYDGGSYLTAGLSPQGGSIYWATLPVAECADSPEFYVSAQGDGGTTVYEPFDAPATVYAVAVGAVVRFFEDDFETDQGWTVFSGATRGNWERGDPEETIHNQTLETIQPEDDHSSNGVMCFVTGPLAGSSVGTYDLDGGPTRLISPVLDLSDLDPTVSYWRYVYIGTTFDDELVVEVSSNGGGSWEVADTSTNGAAWEFAQWKISDFVPVTDQVQIRFTIDDTPNNSLTEVLVDDFLLEAFACILMGNGDFDDDTDVDLADFAAFQRCYGVLPVEIGCQPGDMDGDEDVDLTDFATFYGVIGGPST